MGLIFAWKYGQVGNGFSRIRADDANSICPCPLPRADMKSTGWVSGQKCFSESICSPRRILKRTAGSWLCPHPVTCLWAFKCTHSVGEPAGRLPPAGGHGHGCWHQIVLVSRTRGRLQPGTGQTGLLSSKERSLCAQGRPQLESSFPSSPLQQIWGWSKGGAWGPGRGPAWLPAVH